MRYSTKKIIISLRKKIGFYIRGTMIPFGKNIHALLFVGFLAAAFWCQPIPVAGQKLKASELLAKHQQALGAAETRKSVESLIITGTVVTTFREPGTGKIAGRSVLSSAGDKNLMGMVFDNLPDYPHEKFGFDGEDVSIAYVRPGVRSTFGDFLLTNKSVIKQGLLAGALSTAWPLFNDSGNSGKIEVGGTRRIGDRQAIEVKYFPKGGSDLRVSLFFDAETFQHVRTEYTKVVASQMGATPELSARQTETRYKMVEEFSDFKKEHGLTLPHSYKITLEIRAQRGSFDAEWHITLTDFALNQPIDPNAFDVDG
jgi:hypothetical protein